jgi:hypothetical protein
MEGTTALTVPPAAQTASAPVTHTPSAVPAHVAQAAPAVPTSSPAPAAPAHIVQAAPPAQTSAPASPAPGVTTPKTVAPTAPASSPAVDDPVQDEAGDEAVDDNAPTPAPIDTEVEAKLSAEITVLWATQKDNKATVRRTRAQLKELRLELGAKLHTMKTILARTGRGGGWAAYIRSQKLPLTTVDRYVAQHEAALAPRAEKLPTGDFATLNWLLSMV